MIAVMISLFGIILSMGPVYIMMSNQYANAEWKWTKYDEWNCCKLRDWMKNYTGGTAAGSSNDNDQVGGMVQLCENVSTCYLNAEVINYNVP